MFLLQSSLLRRLTNLLPDAIRGEHTEAAIGLTIIFVTAMIVHFFVREWIVRMLTKLDQKTDSEWYAIILRHKVPQRALFLIPLIIIYNGITVIPEFNEVFTKFVMRVTASLMILVGARVADAMLAAAHSLYLSRPKENLTPIKSYIQLGTVLVYLLAGFFIVSSLADKSPWLLLSGLGAVTAILLLVFRDTLLSLVASVQLTNNDLIRVGDWIEMPQFGADGDVIDIALNTVRIQNWDKTITVIPTHKFLDNSFRNWRGMSESGGRRIMRALNIDITSIRFLTQKEVDKLSQSHLLKDYIKTKMDEIQKYNLEHLKSNTGVITNGRWLTNVGTYRAYIVEYLKRHPRSHKNLLMLVRQLEPTEKGLPLQVYVFTNTTAWAEYEAIQADIFDHLISVAGEFGLRIYQQPTGSDIKGILNEKF